MYDVGRVDLALIPIGGWGPTLEDGHMDPVDGAEAVRRVGAGLAVPVHWGTFWPSACGGWPAPTTTGSSSRRATGSSRPWRTSAPEIRAALAAPGERLDDGS